MTSNNLIARAEITIHATIAMVWDALVNPAVIKQYMFGTNVVSEWKKGSTILWQGEWKGKAYEDKGEILQIIPQQKLQYTHYSPLTGLQDSPENYHTVTIDLFERGNKVVASLSQDNNATEADKEHSEKNWKMMLDGLKQLLEKEGG
jgi:uncharacterized protein YndB with AHSA1/START domain